MLGFKLNYLYKKGPWRQGTISIFDGLSQYSMMVMRSESCEFECLNIHMIGKFGSWLTSSTACNIRQISEWLSHLPQEKMTVISDDMFKCIFMNAKFCVLIRVSLMFVFKDLIDNKSSLFQVMAWCRTSNKPLPEPMMIQFTDAYMQH